MLHEKPQKLANVENGRALLFAKIFMSTKQLKVMSSSSRDRGVVLTVWLVLILVANFVGTVAYLPFAIMPSVLAEVLPDFPLWAIYPLTAFGALNAACVCFLFLWKKWAFFVMCVSAAAILAVNLYINVNAFVFLGPVGLVCTYFVLRRKWALFT